MLEETKTEEFHDTSIKSRKRKRIVHKWQSIKPLDIDFNALKTDFMKITEDKLLEKTKEKAKLKEEEEKAKAKEESKEEKSAEEEREEVLTKLITKEKFKEMRVIGQFNLGFIVAELGNDLFIIDQHASDEKYRFETLQQTTTIKTQRLLIPKTLEVTRQTEIIIIENQKLFEENGFKFI
eukprot:UN24171